MFLGEIGCFGVLRGNRGFGMFWGVWGFWGFLGFLVDLGFLMRVRVEFFFPRRKYFCVRVRGENFFFGVRGIFFSAGNFFFLVRGDEWRWDYACALVG